MAKVYLAEYDRLMLECEEPQSEWARGQAVDVPDELVARWRAAQAEFWAVQGELHDYWKAARYPDGYPIEIEVRVKAERKAAEQALLAEGLA